MNAALRKSASRSSSETWPSTSTPSTLESAATSAFEAVAGRTGQFPTQRQPAPAASWNARSSTSRFLRGLTSDSVRK